MWGFKTEGVVLRAIHRHLLLRYDDNRPGHGPCIKARPWRPPRIISFASALFRQYAAQWATFATHAGAYGLSEPIDRCLASARRPERRPRNSLSCTTQPRDSMILFSTSGRSSMSSTMRLLFGVTRHVRWIEAKSWEEYRGVTGEVSEWSIMN